MKNLYISLSALIVNIIIIFVWFKTFGDGVRHYFDLIPFLIVFVFSLFYIKLGKLMQVENIKIGSGIFLFIGYLGAWLSAIFCLLALFLLNAWS